MGPSPAGIFYINETPRVNPFSLDWPRDGGISFYSLAASGGGVSIDIITGRISFDWACAPYGEIPLNVAEYVRRTHFRDGHHIDEPVVSIVIPYKQD
jgi:hypothetical protein